MEDKEGELGGQDLQPRMTGPGLDYKGSRGSGCANDLTLAPSNLVSILRIQCKFGALILVVSSHRTPFQAPDRTMVFSCFFGNQKWQIFIFDRRSSHRGYTNLNPVPASSLNVRSKHNAPH